MGRPRSCASGFPPFGRPPLTSDVGRQKRAPMKLHEQLEHVSDQESFLAFVRALTQDRRSAAQAESKDAASPYGPDVGGWENT